MISWQLFFSSIRKTIDFIIDLGCLNSCIIHRSSRNSQGADRRRRYFHLSSMLLLSLYMCSFFTFSSLINTSSAEENQRASASMLAANHSDERGCVEKKAMHFLLPLLMAAGHWLDQSSGKIVFGHAHTVSEDDTSQRHRHSHV